MNTTTNSTDTGQAGLGTAFLVSGIFLSVVCPLTVLANSLLIVAIYRDPLKTFRTPASCFLVGLAITDLVTGLVPEPMVTACYFMSYNQHPNVAQCSKIFETAGIVAAITTNASYFIVLAFTTTQYVAVAFPLKFNRLISVRKTMACVVIILLYATLFELTRLMGVPQEVVEKIDLHLHSTFSLLLTIIIYLLLQKAFYSQMAERSATLSTTNTQSVQLSEERLDAIPKEQDQKRRRPAVEKNFVRLNLLLIMILLVCSQPSAILWYVYLYGGEAIKTSQTLFYIRVTVENTLYLKFLLDPFVFAWRLPKYRKALKRAFYRDG